MTDTSGGSYDLYSDSLTIEEEVPLLFHLKNNAVSIGEDIKLGAGGGGCWRHEHQDFTPHFCVRDSHLGVHLNELGSVFWPPVSLPLTPSMWTDLEGAS